MSIADGIRGGRVDISTSLLDGRLVERARWDHGGTDFIARLGSRASEPREVRSRWRVEDYVDLTRSEHDSVIDIRLDRLAYGKARTRRRLDPARFQELVRAMARPPSAELNKARLALVAGIPATTISPYIALVEDLGVVHMIRGTSHPAAKRPVVRPRVIFDDPAAARYFAGIAPDDLTHLAGRRLLAPILEGIAIRCLLGQQENSAVGYRLSHLRERNGLEVDILVEVDDGTLYGLEIRTAAGFRPHQFRNLESLAARAGSLFRGGAVLNTGSAGFRYRPGLWGLPIAALWDWDGTGPSDVQAPFARGLPRSRSRPA